MFVHKYICKSFTITSTSECTPRPSANIQEIPLSEKGHAWISVDIIAFLKWGRQHSRAGQRYSLEYFNTAKRASDQPANPPTADGPSQAVAWHCGKVSYLSAGRKHWRAWDIAKPCSKYIHMYIHVYPCFINIFKCVPVYVCTCGLYLKNIFATFLQMCISARIGWVCVWVHLKMRVFATFLLGPFIHFSDMLVVTEK